MYEEWRGAPYAMKTETLKRWSGIVGLSVSTLYRQVMSRQKKKKSLPARNDYREWVKVVWAIRTRPPEEAGEIITSQAVKIAVKNGLLPVEALDVPISTFDRIAREEKLSKRKKRYNRIQAERPNQVHHFDASSSKFFYVAKEVGGEYILKLHRPAKYYKNKPIPCDRKRPWLYGLTDDHSGLHKAAYTIAHGETAVDSLLFLSSVWADIGLPEELFADQGMLKKCLASSEFIPRLGVALPQAMPYAKESHGKIERPWRTSWQRFELQFFAVDEWRKFEIPLSELSARFANYLEEYNQQPHRFEVDISREQAWKRINLHGGIVTIPEDALATVAKRKKRKLDVAGMLKYEGESYEVTGLHDAWVWVFEGVFEDRLVVQEIETGEKFEVKTFKPLPWGEFRGHKETPHQLAAKASGDVVISDVLYDEPGQKNAEKVIELPIRTKEDRIVEDPFDVTKFATKEEAWQEFAGIVGALISAEDQAEVVALFLEHQLEKQYVVDLAQEVRAALELKRAALG